MLSLFTNRADLHDFVRNAFTQTGWACDVKIAVAFFSDVELIRELVANGCSVDMIVRLGSGTSPQALQECLHVPRVRIRYFSAHTFHPKLYIFGTTRALLGSANLTNAGMAQNAEVAITLPADDPRFDELATLFNEMWQQAKVVDEDVAKQYAGAVAGYPPVSAVDSQVQLRFGQHGFTNIARAHDVTTPAENYVDEYKRSYQLFGEAFAEVSQLYAESGVRIVSSHELPLRIEIDQLFNFIRENNTTGESYRDSPLLIGEERKDKIRHAIQQFQAAKPEYLFTVAHERYPVISGVLGSKHGIEDASPEELLEALLIVHAFYTRMRYFDGGVPTLKAWFLAENGIEKIKNTLLYLIHGPGDYVRRMADCTYGGEHRLKGFGDYCVKETIGWVNTLDIPLCNSRTLKSLRWLGFNFSV
jgi:hypothetical protein